MSNISVNIEMSGLNLKFKYIQRGAQQGLSNTVFEAAVLVEFQAKENAPVRTGYLRDHIKTHMAVETPTQAIAEVVSEADYSPYVEFGTFRNAPHPFMRLALEQKRSEVVSYITDNAKMAIAEEIQAAR